MNFKNVHFEKAKCKFAYPQSLVKELDVVNKTITTNPRE